ncbi:coiled-coil domain-containing protein-domain-containing protein, partial [Tirmania nivea]
APLTPFPPNSLHYLTVNHTKYFDNPTLELADPLLYDKCIRSFQTASEREAEGKAKGWSGILHADLERAEARMEALKKATEDRRNGKEDEDEGDKVSSKEEGIGRWEDAMTRRFLEGGDQDVDYKTIDDNEEYDDVKQIERDVQEAYFDAETPSASEEGSSCTDTGIQDF